MMSQSQINLNRAQAITVPDIRCGIKRTMTGHDSIGSYSSTGYVQTMDVKPIK